MRVACYDMMQSRKSMANRQHHWRIYCKIANAVGVITDKNPFVMLQPRGVVSEALR